MARDGEIIGRYVKPDMGSMREFANLSSDKHRVIFMLLSIQTFPDEPITVSPHKWPDTYSLMDYTPEDCGMAQADWVRVGMAFWGGEGLTLHPMMFGRAKVRRATGKWIDDETRERIYHRDVRACRYCGSQMDSPLVSDVFALDHVVPRSKGGRDDESNLVTSCQSCNSAKGARTPEEAGMKVMPLREAVSIQAHNTWPEHAIIGRFAKAPEHEEYQDQLELACEPASKDTTAAAISKLARLGAIRWVDGVGRWKLVSIPPHYDGFVTGKARNG